MIQQSFKENSRYIWGGVYPSWDLACEAAKDACSGQGLSGDRWLQRIKQQLNDYRNELKFHGIAMPPRSSSLPLVCAMINPDTVLDFGGSCGWCWDYLQNSLHSHNITSYFIIETKEVIGCMIESGLQIEPIVYKTIDDAIGQIDLLYCNSALQYFGSNNPLISLIERAQPAYILLEDLVAINQEDFYTIQTFHNSAIPYRFIGLPILLEELRVKGYLEMVRFPYASPIDGMIKPLPMDNFPKKNQVRHSLSVLLSKKSSK